METQNDQIKIKGTVFEIDREDHQLTEKNNPSNRISFDRMDRAGKHFHFHYDPKKKNILDGPGEVKDLVMIPVKVLTELFSENQDYLINVNKESLYGGWGIELVLFANRQRRTKELPVRNFGGTDFIVDVLNERFTEKNNPENEIPFKELRDKVTHYEFDYDKDIKNVQCPWDFEERNVVLVKVQQMVDIDPDMMALKYNVPLSFLDGKSDFEIIVDQNLLKLRRNGICPDIEICDQYFVVDIGIGYLYPMGDKNFQGIYFDDIDKYRTRVDGPAIVPYDPKTQEIKHFEWDSIVEIPKDWVFINIPPERKLDPYGYADRVGFEIRDFLRENPIQANLKAKIVPWEETGIYPAISANISRNEVIKNKEEKKANSKVSKKKGKRL